MSGECVFVVDDDPSIREVLSIFLSRMGHRVHEAPTGEAALELARQRDLWPALVLTDLNMPGIDGIELTRQFKAETAARGRDVEVIVITAFGSTESAVSAVRSGAADYVTKPFHLGELELVIKRVLGRGALEAENRRMKAELQERFQYGDMVGASAAMQRVYELIRRIKDTRINCLITGPSGSGKEMVARAIHNTGSRSQGPFIPVNCGAIPESLVESELFGYKKGAFTGAVRDKVGLLTAAHGGTLFLDEINSLPLSAQVKMLRALQERRIVPVGSIEEHEVDIRVIAAANVDLEAAVQEGSFREDLYYRLNVVQIGIPALKERREDIPALVQHFLRRFSQEQGKVVDGVEPAASELLLRWGYQGNVRELQNVVERAVALTSQRMIRVEDLPGRLREARPPSTAPEPASADFPAGGIDLDAELADLECRWLLRALEQTAGSKTQAARLLGISFRSFRYRLQKHDLETDTLDD